MEMPLEDFVGFMKLAMAEVVKTHKDTTEPPTHTSGRKTTNTTGTTGTKGGTNSTTGPRRTAGTIPRNTTDHRHNRTRERSNRTTTTTGKTGTGTKTHRTN
jgi:hypothetical protein